MYNDRVMHTLEIRYSNGLLHDFKGRKETKKTEIADPKVYSFFIDILSIMSKDEEAIFKVQFDKEEDNFYLNGDHAQEHLSQEKRDEITDKTCVYLKVKVTSILRDIKDISADELSKIKIDPICFIQNRLHFGNQAKAHAKLALDEGVVNDALKIYRKAQGGMKMVSNTTIKDAKHIVLNKPMEESKLEVLLTTFSEVRVSLLLNQGLCHWKKQEWEKMRQINSEITTVYDKNNVKAFYRLAVANKELGSYDIGLVSFKI